VIALELLWWTGWAWFVAWAALPLLFVPALGPMVGIVVWALLAPWCALLGMALLHRALPASESGTFRLFADRGSTCWALKGWAPSVFLTVFQPLFFLSPPFQRLALRAFQARLGKGAWITSRTIVREPHHVRIGHGSLVGEYAHLVCSYQPRIGLLIVGRIEIGENVLIGAYSLIAAGTRVGDGAILEHNVSVGAGTVIGERVRIGAGSCLYNRVQVGVGAILGKNCVVSSGATIPPGSRIPDGTLVTGTMAEVNAA
jgi:UDP-3-O-[3-hydroxymyristoyl] glucosamine N-acyltransferase